MANQDIPSTPEGSPVSTIVNVVPEQWKKGGRSCIPKPPAPQNVYSEEFTSEYD